MKLSYSLFVSVVLAADPVQPTRSTRIAKREEAAAEEYAAFGVEGVRKLLDGDSSLSFGFVDDINNAAIGGSSKSSKSSHSRSEGLGWLAGEWFLCDARETRLSNNLAQPKYIFKNNTPQCDDRWKFVITALGDGDNVNFKLENGFDTSCSPFGVPLTNDCENNNGKTFITETFVGAASLNPRWQKEINFVGKRLDYEDDDGNQAPVSTLVDGEFTILKVDVTDKEVIYVDWIQTDRRYGTHYNHDVISSRSWKMVKNLRSNCDTCQ